MLRIRVDLLDGATADEFQDVLKEGEAHDRD